MTDSLARYWHTLRWLRPVQFWGRLWFRLYRPKPDLHAAPERCARSEWQWSHCARPSSMLGTDAFRFLSVERRITTSADWNRSDWPKLWLYNAHYFDDLVAQNATDRRRWHQELIARWIAENPAATGNGWEPYPTSLRIVNWLKYLLAGNTPVDGMLDSLAVQARWLRERLEHHLLGNHLWANAKALVFAGAFFDGLEARQWLAHGLRLLRRELREQVLADGGHFERSPMYHAILSEDVLDLIQLSRCFAEKFEVADATAWKTTAERMLHWLRTMTHPDGGIAFFNDAALGIAPNLDDLTKYAEVLGLVPQERAAERTAHLADSGYVRLQVDDAVLLADVAPIGPDYLPGHAHADSLSFELSVEGRRTLVNSGTSTYENNAQRHLERSTSAHNTVVVDGQDSSEVWAAFRVARRARVHDVQVAKTKDGASIAAWHDGYLRLPGKVRHHRAWHLSAGMLEITDTLDGDFQLAEARFHLAPEHGLRWVVEGGDARLEPAAWHPEFGQSQDIEVLVVRFNSPRCRVCFSWNRMTHANPVPV